MITNINAPAPHAFKLYRVEAKAYNRRQTSRLTVTTIEAMTMVAASSTGKFP